MHTIGGFFNLDADAKVVKGSSMRGRTPRSAHRLGRQRDLEYVPRGDGVEAALAAQGPLALHVERLELCGVRVGVRARLRLRARRGVSCHNMTRFREAKRNEPTASR